MFHEKRAIDTIFPSTDILKPKHNVYITFAPKCEGNKRFCIWLMARKRSAA